MRASFILMFISLWITSNAWAWGELGHRIIAEYGSGLVENSTLANCHVTAAQLVSHTNDPDRVWRQQRRKYRFEAEAHFFHVDRQPTDWRTRKEAKDRDQGFLVYRIADWIEEARAARKAQDWDKLTERLYGLSHYLGDLTQPLHLHHDYDGKSVGLPDLHSQFESKMVSRFEEEIRNAVQKRLREEKIPALWAKTDLKTLTFDTAQQSFSKAPRMFESARPALQAPKASKRKKTKKIAEPRFVKKLLWQHTGTLAVDQLTLAARLWGNALNSICK